MVALTLTPMALSWLRPLWTGQWDFPHCPVSPPRTLGFKGKVVAESELELRPTVLSYPPSQGFLTGVLL